MRSLVTTVLAAVAAFLLLPGPMAAQEANQLQGAWRVVEVNPADEEADTDPLPALFLFTGTHYSEMLALGEEARADFSNPDSPTDAEKLEAYDSFVANSGRYEVHGDTITTRAYVARVPNYMHAWPDNKNNYTYEIDGDTLHLNPLFIEGVTLKLRRVEGEPPPY